MTSVRRSARKLPAHGSLKTAPSEAASLTSAEFPPICFWTTAVTPVCSDADRKRYEEMGREAVELYGTRTEINRMRSWWASRKLWKVA